MTDDKLFTEFCCATLQQPIVTIVKVCNKLIKYVVTLIALSVTFGEGSMACDNQDSYKQIGTDAPVLEFRDRIKHD